MEEPPTVAFPARPVTSREAGSGASAGLVPGRGVYGSRGHSSPAQPKRPERSGSPAPISTGCRDSHFRPGATSSSQASDTVDRRSDKNSAPRPRRRGAESCQPIHASSDQAEHTERCCKNGDPAQDQLPPWHGQIEQHVLHPSKGLAPSGKINVPNENLLRLATLRTEQPNPGSRLP